VVTCLYFEPFARNLKNLFFTFTYADSHSEMIKIQTELYQNSLRDFGNTTFCCTDRYPRKCFYLALDFVPGNIDWYRHLIGTSCTSTALSEPTGSVSQEPTDLTVTFLLCRETYSGDQCMWGGGGHALGCSQTRYRPRVLDRIGPFSGRLFWNIAYAKLHCIYTVTLLTGCPSD
jgi:hypothetical protein